MAEHTYSKGDVVALRYTIAGRVNDEARRIAGGREWALVDAENHYVPWVRTGDLAPYMSADEQDALRVVRAAIGARQFTGSAREPGLSFDELTERLKLHGARNHQLDEALSSLPETLRARLEEGG